MPKFTIKVHIISAESVNIKSWDVLLDIWLQVSDFKINLKGMGIGGGWIAPEDTSLYGDYLYQVISKMQSILLSISTKEPCPIQLGKIKAKDCHWSGTTIVQLKAKGFGT